MMYKAKVAVLRSVKKHWTQNERHVEFLNAKPFKYETQSALYKESVRTAQ